MSTFPLWKREGFASENQYRNARARQTRNPETGEFFTSYRQLRDYRSKVAGKPRNYQAERARADRLAQTRGYESANRERSVKGALRKWNVTYDEFNGMRNANRRHWSQVQGGNLPNKFPIYMHKYSEPRREAAGQFVGYIVSYYHAIVDPEHNWDSVRGPDGRWIMVERDTPAGPALVPESDRWWRRYLVEFSGIYQAQYYDVRYGLK